MRTDTRKAEGRHTPRLGLYQPRLDGNHPFGFMHASPLPKGPCIPTEAGRAGDVGAPVAPHSRFVGHQGAAMPANSAATKDVPMTPGREPAGLPRALTPTRAARYLGIGKTKMWGLIMSGRIPSRVLDGRRLILVTDLDAFLDGLPKAAVAS